MSDVIIYLLETSALLVYFYVLYVIILRKETFFQFNRIFLVVVPVFSLLFPVLRLDLNPPETLLVEKPLEEISKFRKTYYDAIALWEFENRAPAQFMEEGHGTAAVPLPFGWKQMLFYFLAIAYCAGALICLSRTVWTLRWITKMVVRYPREEKAGVQIIRIPHPTAPFSFLSYVFIHGPTSDSEEFGQILEHERIHIQEKHSIDLLIVQLVAVVLWFNPVIWRLIKSLKATHEYIADEKIIRSGYSVSAYQTLLLRQLISNNSNELVHNFSLSFIKKRIAMMTHKKSGWSGKIKVALAITGMILFSAFIFQCNTKIDEQLSPLATSAKNLNDLVSVPVLPGNGFRFAGDVSAATTFRITKDVLYVNGNPTEIADLPQLLEGSSSGREVPVIIEGDKDQTMGFIRSIHMALRKLDRRKLLYLGKTVTGERVELMLTLPPDPDQVNLPDAEALAAEGKLEILKIDIGENEGERNQRIVYDFVIGHIAKGSDKYVVSARMQDTDTYGNYLSDYFYIREGFNQIYQERSQKMFAKDFFTTTQDEYKAVRENIPMAISIAED
jgi:hypothetical protein